MINLLLAAAVTVAVLLAALFVHLRVRNLGWLQISTESVAYDHECFGHILSWDRHVFSLHGNPLVLLSGEFHYWRLPDTARWRQVLQQYKAAGLNCIRIYFHWGFHSPAQDTYVFTGNRDIDFLLSLCEELQLFVLCAPGPYVHRSNPDLCRNTGWRHPNLAGCPARRCNQAFSLFVLPVLRCQILELLPGMVPPNLPSHCTAPGHHKG